MRADGKRQGYNSCMSAAESTDLLSSVPLFPLPNVVLFPRAVLPLHIFEQRYKAMTADTLEANRLVAMALLKPGWEKAYYQRPAIEPVVCVGRILSWEKLTDGCYNFLLQGWLRAEIVREFAHTGRPYRLAELRPLPQGNTLEIDLGYQRDRLQQILSQEHLSGLTMVRQYRELIGSPLPTADVADLAAFSFLDDVLLKQELLADTDVPRRVERLVKAMEHWAAHARSATAGYPTDPGAN